MNAFLPSIHFKRLVGEACLYYREEDVDHTICIISLYVDDILIAGNTLAIVQNRLKNQLDNQYDMKDLGVVRHILGCELKHELHSGIPYLTQYQYTKKVVEKFFGNDLKPSDTPFDSSIILSKSVSPNTNDEKEVMQEIPYQEAVGTLLWLSLGTRP